ncbi:MAG TPA: APC family permease [Fimbriimonas sp.]|nr:APC family permease [Fimbriimonas sp.]
MTDAPKGSIFSRLRRTLFGAPIPTSRAQHERLSPITGLAVFASDNLSSVAYATEAILAVLVMYGSGALKLQLWISIGVACLIAIIANAYRATIKAYPQGGGSYIVTKDNLGEIPGIVSGAALLVDYTMTVAVSVAAGVAAIASAFPQTHPYLLHMCMGAIALVAWANLRGLKESGALFALPTYGFILTMFGMLIFGSVKAFQQGPVEQVVSPIPEQPQQALVWIIVLRAFAAGCTALTGIEAVSDGVQAFQPPSAKNASATLGRMAVMLALLFLGMGYIAQHLPSLTLYSAKDPNFKTVASQVAAFTFGAGSIPFYAVQFFTAAILILAANTAFADFPRLASFLARDQYLPRYMARLGDRLMFHNGIIVLAVAAGLLIFAFHGEVDHLLPLYAVGIFTAFTLSQLAMVQFWKRNKEPGWQRRIVTNVIGAALCAIVLVMLLLTKFMAGAWIAVLSIVTICVALLSVNRRYRNMSAQLEITLEEELTSTADHVVLLLVPRMHNGIISALRYAQHLKGTCQAVHVTINEKNLPTLMREWDQLGQDVPLVVLPSPYRSLIAPVLDYVDELRERDPNVAITVVVPEAVSTKWYHKLLHENVALQLKQALARRRNVVVANVRYFLQ